MTEKDDLTNRQQTISLIPTTLSTINRLEYFRMIDTLYVKQQTSLSESKLFIKIGDVDFL